MLSVLVAAVTPRVVAEGVMWYSAEVTTTMLASSVSMSLQTRGERMCAMRATHTPWCHLFTYQDRICILYELQVLSYSQDQGSTTTTCKTRHTIGNTLTPTTTHCKQLMGPTEL
ncbi:hypothetical protein Hamer_G002710 [Homarus americanus]|uniref:Secreted protein n=1 Tax=Homarus americanus TaxID=6706 RepID=A0A8J5JSP3_HOMAM|nr:hypothetical protein Hamer_G002710 [Homarus americanus]